MHEFTYRIDGSPWLQFYGFIYDAFTSRNENEVKWGWAGMRTRFQCLHGKNKWEWECAGMSLMCLLGKINENEEWEWESIYQNTKSIK